MIVSLPALDFARSTGPGLVGEVEVLPHLLQFVKTLSTAAKFVQVLAGFPVVVVGEQLPDFQEDFKLIKNAPENQIKMKYFSKPINL